MFNPQFQYTNKMIQDLMSIEKSKAIVDLLPIPADVEKKLRINAQLKMTHYSTKIEGNPLSLEQVSNIIYSKRDHSRIRAEEEVRNYWEALSFLTTARKLRQPITEHCIQRLHALIELRGLGKRINDSLYRGPTAPGILFAVYDTQTRLPEYIPPEYSDVPLLMEELVEWINKEKELPASIKAAIAAYQLLTIHPFEDGNGRTSRALATYILSMEGYNLKGFNSMEEYYAADLTGYYANIQMGLPVLYYDGRNSPPNLAPWIEYFIRIMAYAFDKVAELAKKNTNNRIHPVLSKLEPKEIVLLRALLLNGGQYLKPKEIAEIFTVHPRTITNWTREWVEKGLLQAASGKERITSYSIGKQYAGLTLTDLGYLDDAQ